MPAYSSLYSNFIRQGSTFAKSVTAHGYAQSVVAATHPHTLNSHNRPVFGRRHNNRLGRLTTLQLHSAFHTEKTSTSAFAVVDRQPHNHGGLDAYFEALQEKQAADADAEIDAEWSQYEFPKRIEWKPESSDVLTAEQPVDLADAPATSSHDVITRSFTPEEEAALAHIDAALEKELEVRSQKTVAENASALGSRSHTPASFARSATPVVDPQSQAYADHLHKLSDAGRYAEIPAVFEAMLATGVRPIAGAYNALLMAAIHLPSQKTEVVSKVLDVYADMIQRKVSLDSKTYNTIVGLLASRSLEVSEIKRSLEEKRVRFGGMDEPGEFMLQSHAFEYAILCEDDRLGLAIKLFDTSIDQGLDGYSAETYHQLISACAQSGRVSEMQRLFDTMDTTTTVPFAATFPTMITAFAKSGDLVGAVECYEEYRNLAVADDAGMQSLCERRDAQVYAAVINAYVVSDKIEGAMKFFNRIVAEYGVRAVELKDALVSAGFVQGFISRGILEEAFHWAQSVGPSMRAQALSQIAIVAADKDDMSTALDAYAHLPAGFRGITTPAMAMLAMCVRSGNVSEASKYWEVLSDVKVPATQAFIEPTTMYAVALIGTGQVATGLAQSEMMFQRIRSSAPELAEEIDEGIEFISTFMEASGLTDPREVASQVSHSPQKTMSGSSFTSPLSTASYEDNFDPYAHSTDFKGSSLIADDLEGGNGRRGPRLGEALNRFKNIRRAGRHPRYITYAKLISAAAREGKMDICQDVLAMARADVPLMPEFAVVRYGWSSILDAMVGACLNMGNRGRAEQYHQELLEMGAAPSANTFGLYITTLKDSTKTFDEASEAVRIFHRAKAEGVEPSSFLYNALIGKLGKARRIDDCLFYFAEMRQLGIKPTSVTYGTVVNALCRVSDEQFAEELFDEMEAMPNYKARPAPYNSMMQFFLTTKRDKSKVLAYFNRMVARGITPTTHTYKLLVDTHATLDPVDMEAAENVLVAIRKAGQQVQPVHYASLIHARGCVLHDVDGARKIFDSLVVDPTVQMNSSLYQALFEVLVANHKISDTESVLQQMREQNIELTPYIANTLIHGWASAKNIVKAQSVYDALGRDKREPSTYEAMTRAFLAVEERDSAQRVVSEMVTRGYPSAVVNKALELLGGGQETPLA